jgi:outer membrane protein assembly factor BamA
MIKRLFLLLILAWSTALATVRFEGQHHLNRTELDIAVRASNSEPEVEKAIEAAYVNEGYLTARCNAGTVGSDTLIRISEGARALVGNVTVVGIEDSIAAKIMPRYRPSDPLTRERLLKMTKDVIGEYANNGYPFTQAEIESIDVVQGRVQLHFRIVSGPFVSVGQIEFPGLRTTKPETLRRRIELQAGQIYREADLQATNQTLSRLRHCQPSGKPLLTYESRDTTVSLQLPMRDERSFAFDGFAFLQPDNSVAGQVDATLINLLGHGEEAGVLWSRANEKSSRLNLRFLWPYVADYPIDLQGRLSQEDRDSAFVSTSVQVEGVYHLADDWSVGAGFKWEKITPEENRPTIPARLMAVDLSTLFDQRDNARQTHRGVLLSQHLISGFRRSFAEGGVMSGYSTQLDGDVRMWHPLSERLVAYARLRYFQTKSDFDPIPTDQLTSIGGYGSLRGYRENSYLSDRGGISTVEVRWYAAGNFMLHLFSDNGYIRDLMADRWLTGFGAGMVVTTTLGDFRFELSYGEEKRVDKMLVHLGLEAKL